MEYNQDLSMYACVAQTPEAELSMEPNAIVRRHTEIANNIGEKYEVAKDSLVGHLTAGNAHIPKFLIMAGRNGAGKDGLTEELRWDLQTNERIQAKEAALGQPFQFWEVRFSSCAILAQLIHAIEKTKDPATGRRVIAHRDYSNDDNLAIVDVMQQVLGHGRYSLPGDFKLFVIHPSTLNSRISEDGRFTFGADKGDSLVHQLLVDPKSRNLVHFWGILRDSQSLVQIKEFRQALQAATPETIIELLEAYDMAYHLQKGADQDDQQEDYSYEQRTMLVEYLKRNMSTAGAIEVNDRRQEEAIQAAELRYGDEESYYMYLRNEVWRRPRDRWILSPSRFHMLPNPQIETSATTDQDYGDESAESRQKKKRNYYYERGLGARDLAVQIHPDLEKVLQGLPTGQ